MKKKRPLRYTWRKHTMRPRIIPGRQVSREVRRMVRSGELRPGKVS